MDNYHTSMTSLSIIIMIMCAKVCEATLGNLGRDVCNLTNASIFETSGSMAITDYSSIKSTICNQLGRIGDNKTCCSKEELESLQTRWQSTKWNVYKQRIVAWVNITKAVIIDADKELRAHIEKQANLKAVKLDCKEAAKEVSKRLQKNDLKVLWNDWQASIKKCLGYTIKTKISLFCAICSPSLYKNLTIVYQQDNRSILRVSYPECHKFLGSCSDFIKQQTLVREYISAAAALSKCDERGWTGFDQEYVFKARNQSKIDLVDEWNKVKGQDSASPTAKKLCDSEFSVSTMLASDLKDKQSWVSFAKNAQSVFKKYNIQKTDMIDKLYQADDEHSVRQDLPNWRIETGADIFNLNDFYSDSNFVPKSDSELNAEIEQMTKVGDAIKIGAVFLCCLFLI